MLVVLWEMLNGSDGVMINILSTSDIHIDVPRVAPGVITENFKSKIFPHMTVDLDLLIIAGDLSDGALDMSGPASYELIELISDTVKLAVKNNIMVRILQGTFTHDRRHNQFFKLFAHPLVKVVTTLDIEIIDHLGISILYKPDDLPYKDAIRRIKVLLKECSISKVDIFVNHGFFTHLLPHGMPHTPSNTFSHKDTESFVKGIVLNGHVHSPGVYRNIVNNGSFDRLQHGEEEKKGFFLIQYSPSESKVSHTFVENDLATIFKTIDVSDIENNLPDCKKRIDTVMKKIIANNKATSPDMFVRVMSNDVVARQALATYITSTYSHTIVSIAPKKRKTNETTLLNQDSFDDLPLITEDNLPQMLVELLEKRETPLTVEFIKNRLEK